MRKIKVLKCKLPRVSFNHACFLNILIFSGLFVFSFPTLSMEKGNDAQIDVNKEWPLRHYEWPQNLASLRSKELDALQRYCSRMVEYEELMLERYVWKKRLEKIEIFQQKRNEHPKEDEDFCESYKVRRIYINNKNPNCLDLHGVSSAADAKDKVLQFITSAKSKRKNQVLIITGKGNHINRRGSKGVLFKSLPKWLEYNENVIDIKVRENRGSYIVFLTPPSRYIVDIGLFRYFKLIENCHHSHRIHTFHVPSLHAIKDSNNTTSINALPIHELPLIKGEISKTQLDAEKQVDFQKKQKSTKFPEKINYKNSKKYLIDLCKFKGKEPPKYSCIAESKNNMKTATVSIEGLSSYIYKIEKRERGYQQFLAQEVYKKITGKSVAKRQAKYLLQKFCEKKGHGIPQYQILGREFKVKVSVNNLTQEEVSRISQADAESRAAKKMYEILRELL